MDPTNNYFANFNSLNQELLNATKQLQLIPSDLQFNMSEINQFENMLNPLLARINQFVIESIGVVDVNIEFNIQKNITPALIRTLNLVVIDVINNNVDYRMTHDVDLDLEKTAKYAHSFFSSFSKDLMLNLQCLNSKKEEKPILITDVAKMYAEKIKTKDELEKTNKNIRPTQNIEEKMFLLDWYLAIDHENLEKIKSSVSEFPSLLTAKDKNGDNSLHLAAYGGNRKIIEFFILKCPILLNEKNNDGHLPYAIAQQNGHVEVTKYMITERLNFIALSKHFGEAAKPEYTTANWFSAIKQGNLEKIKIFLEKNPSFLKMKNEKGSNALHLAVISGKLDVVRFFHNKSSALIKEKTISGNTALHLACNANLEVVEFIYEKNPKLLKIKAKGGHNALHNAVIRGKLEIVKFLYGKDHTLLGEKAEDCNNLHLAIDRGQLELITFIYDKAPKFVQEKRDGANAIHLVARGAGQLEIFKFLYEINNKLIKEKTNNGSNVLHLAATRGHLNVSKFSIGIYPDLLNQKNNDGFYAFKIAQQNGYIELAEYLITEKIKLTANSTLETKLSNTKNQSLNAQKVIVPQQKQINENFKELTEHNVLTISKTDEDQMPKNQKLPSINITRNKDSKNSIYKYSSNEINSKTVSHREKKLTIATDPENVKTNEIISINEKKESHSIELINTDNPDISKKSKKTLRKNDSTLKKAKNIWENTVGMNKDEKTKKREERKLINRESMSMSQSQQEDISTSYHERKIVESSVSISTKEKSKRSKRRETLSFTSTSHQEDSLRSEQSEIELENFKALVNLLSSRDIKTLNEVELEKKIIGETLLQLKLNGIIKITHSRKNKNKVRATLKGAYTGLKRPSLTIHMHDHNLPWEKQNRVRDHFFDFLAECGIDPFDIMQKFDVEASDAGEGG